MRWFPPGEIFGGAAMLPESADYLISTEAVTNITVLAWDRTTIARVRARYERLADNVAMIAYDYLVLYRSLHLAARCDTAPQRFALVLANLATGIGRRVDGGFELDVRNEELVNEAGVTIFTASRLMSRWALEGISLKAAARLLFCRSPRFIPWRAPYRRVVRVADIQAVHGWPPCCRLVRPRPMTPGRTQSNVARVYAGAGCGNCRVGRHKSAQFLATLWSRRDQEGLRKSFKASARRLC